MLLPSLQHICKSHRSLVKGLGLSLSLGVLMAPWGAIAAPQLAFSTGTKQTATSVPPVNNDTRFACQFVNGQYTVMYYPQSQPSQAYPWATPTALGGGWTPERRCNEISRRLEFYRPQGLIEMQTGVENGYNIVCVTTQQNPSCRIVFTVPPGQDPVATRDRVFESLTVADSGQSTDAVTTFRGRDSDRLLNQIGEALNIDLPPLPGRRAPSSGIDLRPFLDRTDGGNSARLSGGVPVQSNQLNPNNFR